MPTVEERRSTKVITLYDQRREREDVRSIGAAVRRVKEIHANAPDSLLCTKIVTKDDDIVYDSTRNGDIQTWENEWERAKTRLTSTRETHNCNYGNGGCVADDLCPDCQFDKQMRGDNHATE
ncbi:hypothetical protein [Halomicrococcus gelatinilyticus]|uniref:hypothetical protein n=1 Tax=Halomicrococcus gelatinilyticus TaxID=1702103 RepID=UPI002E0E0704